MSQLECSSAFRNPGWQRDPEWERLAHDCAPLPLHHRRALWFQKTPCISHPSHSAHKYAAHAALSPVRPWHTADLYWFQPASFIDALTLGTIPIHSVILSVSPKNSQLAQILPPGVTGDFQRLLQQRLGAQMMWKSTLAALALCATLDGFASAADVRPGDEICTITDANACGVDEIKTSELDSSTLIYPGGETRCAFDDSSVPSANNFTTNSTYFFQVFPNEKKEKKKVFLYFQGGGACIDDATCNYALQCSVKGGTFYPNARAVSTGILNRTDPDNMFADWNIVHLPYCTGDLHIGNKVNGSTESGLEAILGYADCMKKNMSIHQVGYLNTMAVLKWALTNFPDPEHLIVGGSSAGALAAQILAGYVADAWKVDERSIRYSILADSYVGVLPKEKAGGELVRYFGACDVDLKAPADVIAGCKTGKVTVTDMVSAQIKQTPYSDWLFIDSKSDSVQRYFYQMFKQGIFAYPFPNLISGADFFSNMTTMIDTYKTVTSRVSTFFIDSEQHVYLMYQGFFHNATSTTGDNLGEFLNEWLLPHANTTGVSSSQSGGSSTGATPTVGSAASRVGGFVLVNSLVVMLVGMLL